MTDDGSAFYANLLPAALDPARAREPRADCGACVMLVDHGEEPSRAFHPDVRCCTYQPMTANFLAGRALRRGGDSARVVRARLADPSGVTAWGIGPTDAFARRSDELRAGGFGRDPSMRCRFLVAGELACGVWRDRPGVCRTWFCKHDRGRAGAVDLQLVRIAMEELEAASAALCVRAGTPPAEATATASAWIDWFEWCAARIDALTETERERLRALPDVVAAGEQVRDRDRSRERDDGDGMPAVLVPAIAGVWRVDDRYLLTGYSPHDAVSAPAAVFELLARLDGERTWQQAVADAGGDGPDAGVPAVTAALVRDLYRIDAVASADSDDPAHVVRVGALGEAWADPQTLADVFGEGV